MKKCGWANRGSEHTITGIETVAHGALSDPPECWMENNTLCFVPVGTWDCQSLPAWQCNLLKKTHTSSFCEDKDCFGSLLVYVVGPTSC